MELTERIHTDPSTRTFQKSNVRKVLTHRSFLKRWPGWAAMLFSTGVVTLVPLSGDYTRREMFLPALILSIPISIPYFIGSRMGRIYEVPPAHRDLSRPPGPTAVKAEKPNDSK